MRFAFAGIDFLSDVFFTLVEKGWEPVKLFTRPCDGIYDFNDRVVERARQLKLPIQLSRLRPKDFADLAALDCEALVVAGYPWLIHGWERHLHYAVNVHPSPLPMGRGPYPLFQAILDDVPNWGVTIHSLAPEFDTGAVLAQELFPVSPAETHETLLARCQMAAKRLSAHLADDLPQLWLDAKPQGSGSYWVRVPESRRTLDWTQTVEQVLRTVRAFGTIEAIATIGPTKMFVRSASGWTEPHGHKPGTVVHSHRRQLVVAVQDGFVQIQEWSVLSLESAQHTGR